MAYQYDDQRYARYQDGLTLFGEFLGDLLLNDVLDAGGDDTQVQQRGVGEVVEGDVDHLTADTNGATIAFDSSGPRVRLKKRNGARVSSPRTP